MALRDTSEKISYRNKRLFFVEGLTLAQRATFEELLQAGDPCAAFTARYLCLGEHETSEPVSAQEVALAIGASTSRAQNLGARVYAVMHYLAPWVEVSPLAKRYSRGIAQRTKRRAQNGTDWEVRKRRTEERIREVLRLGQDDEVPVGVNASNVNTVARYRHLRASRSWSKRWREVLIVYPRAAEMLMSVMHGNRGGIRSQVEVAREYGVSRQAVMDAVKRVLDAVESSKEK